MTRTSRLVVALVLALTGVVSLPLAYAAQVIVRSPVITPAIDLTVTIASADQTIDGFGANETFLNAIPSADLDLLFSPTLGIGLSIMRVGIASDGGTLGTFSNAVGAAARGAVVIATPWSAAAGQKDNGSETNGGHLLVGSYNAWATTLAGFQATLVAAGGPPLYAVSVQNEPDFTASYASMVYTTAEMVAFINVLGPKLAALSPAPKLMMPEVANWPSNLSGYTTAVAADSAAKSSTAIVGTHQYSGAAANDGHLPGVPLWQTEMSYFSAWDPLMTQALVMAADIHTALTVANVNAWLYWWLVGLNNDNEGLIGYSGDPAGNVTITVPTLTKRLYALGNYSKFIRPGYVRVETTGSVANVSATAYTGPGKMVVVAINQSSSARRFNFTVPSHSATSVTPYLTSASADLAQQPDIGRVSGVFVAMLPALSVTTFVGAGS